MPKNGLHHRKAVAADDVAERRTRKDVIRSENAERKARPERAEQARGDGRVSRQDKDDGATLGFGDDMPAFMRIAAKI